MNYAQANTGFAKYIEELKKKQFYEWMHWEPYSKTVPANAGIEDEVEIKSGQHFKTAILTGNFTTLIDDGQGAALDDGTNHMTIAFLDGSTEIKLSAAPVPLDLCLTPGRVLATGVTGNPSGQLFWPFPFPHIFGAKGSIQFALRNNADWPNTVNLLFVGTHLLNQRITKENF